MILKYYEGINPADKTRSINYIDLNKVAHVEIVQKTNGDLDKNKYTFVLNCIDSSEISRTSASISGCLYYFFDSRDEVEKLIDDILCCHLTNRVHIYDLDENIRKLDLSCKGRNCTSREWH